MNRYTDFSVKDGVTKAFVNNQEVLSVSTWFPSEIRDDIGLALDFAYNFGLRDGKHLKAEEIRIALGAASIQHSL